MAATIDRQKTCPLCGGDNACAAAAGQPAQDCWCWSANLDPEALAAIPADARDRYCICANCGRARTEAENGR